MALNTLLVPLITTNNNPLEESSVLHGWLQHVTSLLGLGGISKTLWLR
jgi:hypothetical protein